MIPYPSIDPVAFDLGFISVHWYGISYFIGISIAWILLRYRSSNSSLALNNEKIADLVFFGMVGIILGGRLGSIIFYNLGYYLENPIEIFYIHQGGMSFHGGLIGVIVAMYLFSIKTKTSFFKLTDFIAPVVPIGLGCGRIANFINGELWGGPSNLPWAMIFPDPAAGGISRHPSQLYEALLEGLLLGALLIFLAFHKGALKRPGFICGTFFVGYGIARSIVELVRQPDAQFTSVLNPIGYVIQFGDWGITMGQLLSIPMVLIGLILMIRAKAIST